MSTAVFWVKGDSGQKTQEPRSLVSIISKPLKFSALANQVSLVEGYIIGRLQFEIQAVYVSLLDYSQDITNEMQGASNQYLERSGLVFLGISP